MGAKQICLAVPNGFCAGVDRALRICREALANNGGRLYCYHELVHNDTVVEALQRAGVVFVQSLQDVPVGETVLFSAHGVPPAAHAEAASRRLQVVDATCPFVMKVHQEAIRYAGQGMPVILIGHRRHDEVIGVLGEAPAVVTVVENAAEAASLPLADGSRPAVLSQTTLSQEETDQILSVLRRRYPALLTPEKDDICYATTNRQAAVRAIAQQCDVVWVFGSASSSNSNRLVEVARAAGAPAVLVNRLEHLPAILDTHAAAASIGLSAGASTPGEVLTAAIAKLQAAGYTEVKEICVATETLQFS